MTEEYKVRLIDTLIGKDALRIGGAFPQPNGRMAPYSFDLSRINDGEGLAALSTAYAQAILTALRPDGFDGIFAVPGSATLFGTPITIALYKDGHNKPYSTCVADCKYDNSINPDERQDLFLSGAKMPKDSRQAVISADIGDTTAINKALETLRYSREGVKIPGIVAAIDHQEIDEDGENPLVDSSKDGIPRFAALTRGDIFEYVKGKSASPAENEKPGFRPEDIRAFEAYIRAWGTIEGKESYGLGSKPVIDGRTLILSWGTDYERSENSRVFDPLDRFNEFVRATQNISQIGGYEIGPELLTKVNLAADTVRRAGRGKKIIYDQRALGISTYQASRTTNMLREGKVDAAILFPYSGPRAQIKLTGELLQSCIEPIVGADTNHDGYLSADKFIEIYQRAATTQGVANFVVPGTKPDKIQAYSKAIAGTGLNPTFFIDLREGGDLESVGTAASECGLTNWHVIVSAKGSKDLPRLEQMAKYLEGLRQLQKVE